MASKDPVPNRKRTRLAISNAGKASGAWSHKFKSTNTILGDAFAALKFEHQNNPALFGSGMLGLQSFYPRYRDFVAKVKKRTGSIPKLYIASVDVRHCYDNIDQDRLLQIVMNVLSEDDYMIHRYSQLHANQSTSRVAKKRKMEVGLPETFDVFHKWTSDATSGCGGAVFLDEANSSLANRDKILALVREHLKSHLVVAKGRYGNRCLLQSKGIPQGSILSSFLCNFYYGNIERELIGSDLSTGESSDEKIANDQHHLLARIIDDFFLITTDQSTHRSFLQAMYQGKPSLGAQINRDKVFSNVQVNLKDDTGTTHTVEDATSDRSGMFSWCGMLFDNQSLEVQIDYTRFLNEKAGNNLTVAQSEEGEQLRKAMKTFVRPRCLPILFDPAINTQATRDASFFDLLLLCATKTEKYLEISGHARKPLHSNVAFLLSCIEDVILFSLHIIKYRLQHESCVNGVAVDLPQTLAQCLGWNAFLVAFDESPRLRILAPKIKEKLQRYREDPRVSQALKGSPQLKLAKTAA